MQVLSYFGCIVSQVRLDGGYQVQPDDHQDCQPSYREDQVRQRLIDDAFGELFENVGKKNNPENNWGQGD